MAAGLHEVRPGLGPLGPVRAPGRRRAWPRSTDALGDHRVGLEGSLMAAPQLLGRVKLHPRH